MLIGGLAAVLHGSPLPTVDADICPLKDRENLERLAAALEELDARIRTPDAAGGVPFPRDAAFLMGVELLNLVTRAGDLDLAFTPAGTNGFADLAVRAVPMTIRRVTVAVAALEDVIRAGAQRESGSRRGPKPHRRSRRDQAGRCGRLAR